MTVSKSTGKKVLCEYERENERKREKERSMMLAPWEIADEDYTCSESIIRAARMQSESIIRLFDSLLTTVYRGVVEL